MSKIGKSVDRESRSGLPWWLSGEESACPCRGHRFGPWPGKIPHATGQLSLCAMTTESRPQSACSAREEPPLWQAWAPQLEWSTHSLQLVKACAQQQLQPIGSPRVRRDWRDLAHTRTMILGCRQASSAVVKNTERQNLLVEYLFVTKILGKYNKGAWKTPFEPSTWS